MEQPSGFRNLLETAGRTFASGMGPDRDGKGPARYSGGVSGSTGSRRVDQGPTGDGADAAKPPVLNATWHDGVGSPGEAGEGPKGDPLALTS